MIKGYKIRLFPTVKQEQAIWKHIGACRFVWNWMLTKQEELHDSGGKYMYALGMMRLLSQLRNDDRYAWLKEVSCTSCRTVCRDLDEAYRLFFDHKCGHPKFKTRKRAKQIYPVRSDYDNHIGSIRNYRTFDDKEA